MNQKISVVIPVYNVERYLDRCLQSVVNQTYTNLQILLVDDGSTDGSGRLAEQWASRDARIVVLHKPNGGLSDARNYAMRYAEGEYWAFVDSDDFIRPQMMEGLLKACLQHEAQAGSGVRRGFYGGTAQAASRTDPYQQQRLQQAVRGLSV